MKYLKFITVPENVKHPNGGWIHYPSSVIIDDHPYNQSVQEVMLLQYASRITTLEAELASLTAGSEAMQEDARNNTATINAQAEEIRTLKQELDQLKACKHMHVKIHSRLWRASTLEEPAEFEYKAECKDCKEWFSADDVDEWAEVEE